MAWPDGQLPQGGGVLEHEEHAPYQPPGEVWPGGHGTQMVEGLPVKPDAPTL